VRIGLGAPGRTPHRKHDRPPDCGCSWRHGKPSQVRRSNRSDQWTHSGSLRTR
jgi:hypothetical protein